MLKKYPRIKKCIPMVLAYGWFFILEQLNKSPAYILHAKLDEAFPFVKEYVIPYVFWYFYVFGALVWFFITDETRFSRLANFLTYGLIIACIAYTLYPNGQNMRPAALGGDIFSSMVAWLYAHDTPANSAPSLHVIFSVAVHAEVMKSQVLSKFGKGMSLVACVLICLSTLYIKQHSVICLVTGLAVSGVLYAVIYKGTRAEKRQTQTI